MQILNELCYLIEDMVEPIVEKGDISPTELDNVRDAAEALFYIYSVNAMKRGGNSYNNSFENSFASNKRYMRNSYDGMMGMDGDNDGRYSERTERRYSYRGNSNRGYSREYED